MQAGTSREEHYPADLWEVASRFILDTSSVQACQIQQFDQGPEASNDGGQSTPLMSVTHMQGLAVKLIIKTKSS